MSAYWSRDLKNVRRFARQPIRDEDVPEADNVAEVSSDWLLFALCVAIIVSMWVGAAIGINVGRSEARAAHAVICNPGDRN